MVEWMTFAIMFRLKFRFPTKVTFFVCVWPLILANLICMYSSKYTGTGSHLICKHFPMGATSMNSYDSAKVSHPGSINLFSYIYLLVQGCVQLSGLITICYGVLSKWEYMHWLIIAWIGLVMLASVILFRNYCSMPKLPLYGIDWLGAAMWAPPYYASFSFVYMVSITIGSIPHRSAWLLRRCTLWF